MLKIGLTGGIASGKSTVSELFEKHGIPVIDADQVAHDLVKPGRPALQAIVAEFGKNILKADGSLDRRKLRELVFLVPKARKKLEAILHPLVFTEMERLAQNCNAPYIIFSVPLLVETESMNRFDRILVVDCPEKQQIQRLRQRDPMPPEIIDQILSAQATRSQRLAVADDVIVNDGSLDKLAKQVEELHQFYRRQSDN